MTQPDKHPGGRPSLYDPKYYALAIELGRAGKSTEYIAADLGIGKSTLYRWREEFPEFRDALEVAKEFELKWWEEIAQTLMVEQKDAPRLNSSIWSRSMAARFPDKYRESTKTEVTGANGADLFSGIKVVHVSAKNE